jgi:hypothetical protein
MLGRAVPFIVVAGVLVLLAGLALMAGLDVWEVLLSLTHGCISLSKWSPLEALPKPREEEP